MAKKNKEEDIFTVTVTGKCVGCDYVDTCSLSMSENISKDDIHVILTSDPIEFAPRSCREREINTITEKGE